MGGEATLKGWSNDRHAALVACEVGLDGMAFPVLQDGSQTLYIHLAQIDLMHCKCVLGTHKMPYSDVSRSHNIHCAAPHHKLLLAAPSTAPAYLG